MKIIYWIKLPMALREIADAVGALDGVELVLTNTLDETLDALPGSEGLLLAHGPEAEAARILSALAQPDSTVKWLHFVTAGREGYDEQGYPANIQVTYPAGAVAPAVAEHAMALLLTLCRRIPDVVTKVMLPRRYDRDLVMYDATSLEGQTLAIIGYGQIGREIAARARAFGMRIITVSRSAAPDSALINAAYPLSDMPIALAQADAVVIAIALTPETTHLLGKREFDSCKPGAYLVNVARGRVLDQDALGEALASGRLKGAALDVCDPEPLPEDNPLWDYPSVFIAPHYAAAGSQKSMDRVAMGIVENIGRLQAGEPLLGRVS